MLCQPTLRKFGFTKSINTGSQHVKTQMSRIKTFLTYRQSGYVVSLFFKIVVNLGLKVFIRKVKGFAKILA